MRSSLVDRIAAAVAERRLTHAQVAKLAHTSRTRISAILNRNTSGVSTDLLLRILGRLGPRIVVTRAAWIVSAQAPGLRDCTFPNLQA